MPGQRAEFRGQKGAPPARVSALFFVLNIIMALLSAAPLHAQRGPASLPASQLMPRSTLDQIDRTELGSLYKPADAAKLFQAHQQIERYFASSSNRKDAVASLEALGLDPNIIGRLTRIRMDWPALAPGVFSINEKVGPYDVRYFLGIPQGYDRAKPWPLVIKLLSADAVLADPPPDAEQVQSIYMNWITDELAQHPDAIVVVPVLNPKEMYGPSYAGMNSVIQPMQHVANRCNIDPCRVYMVGQSASASAAWNLALHYSTYFAAFTALAGEASAEWQRVRLMNLRNLLPVAWHDFNDEIVKIDASRSLIQALRGMKLDVDYVETRNVGHVPTDAIAEERFKKMRARRRPMYPKQITLQSNRPDTMFNRNDWVQIYQPLNPGQERRLLFRGTAGTMLVYPNSYSVDATISNNTIAVTSRNVQSVRFYINDQMIDPTRAVSVTFNRVPRFESIVKLSIEEMLKDQLFLGRGWRYYTGVIDIDFGK